MCISTDLLVEGPVETEPNTVELSSSSPFPYCFHLKLLFSGRIHYITALGIDLFLF